jgi:hypothetical protein
LLRQVLADGRVTVARIEGAIALYLLAALVFAHVYGVLEMASAGAFTLGRGNGPVHTLDRRFVYFSLITQTSTGCQSARKRDPGSASNRDPLLAC